MVELGGTFWSSVEVFASSLGVVTSVPVVLFGLAEFPFLESLLRTGFRQLQLISLSLDCCRDFGV